MIVDVNKREWSWANEEAWVMEQGINIYPKRLGGRTLLETPVTFVSGLFLYVYSLIH